MNSYYTLTDLDSIQGKASRFKYCCCNIFREYVAFGTSAGSVHIYKLPCTTPPIVISVSSLINAVTLLSFSPNGKWLILGDIKGLHFIEDPLTSSSLFFSIDTKDSMVRSIAWFSEPPPKINRTPYVLAGDDSGCIWAIRHHNADLFVTLTSGINQLCLIDGDNTNTNISNLVFLAMTRNGPILVSNNKTDNTVSTLQIGRKPPSGEFGGLFYKDYQAILIARPEGKLSVASLEGVIKGKFNFPASIVEDPTDHTNTNYLDMHHLMLCSPFLVSVGPRRLCYIINLKPSPKLTTEIPEFANVIGYANDKSRAIFLCPNRICLFSVCANPLEYVQYLIKSKNFSEAQKIVMEQKIADDNILEGLKMYENPKFAEYVGKLELMNQPKMLEEVDAALYAEFKAVSVPTAEMMSKLFELKSLMIVDDQIKQKIEAYVIEYPNDGFKWIDEIDPDYIVPLINENEKAAEIVRKLAKRGTSELCKMLTKVDTLPIEACVANSPPLRPHNFTGERRVQFEKALSLVDVNVFVSEEEVSNLTESLYSEEFSKIDVDHITPDQTYKLLKIYDWERQVSECIQDLKSKMELHLLSQGAKSVPLWIVAAIDAERKNRKMPERPAGNTATWGVIAQLTICPICGMQLNLGESVTSANVFPCSHIYHVSCLHQRYCPICYANCMQ